MRIWKREATAFRGQDAARLCENSIGSRTAGSFERWPQCSPLWGDSLLGMLSTVDLILHKEMALLFQTAAIVGAHITLGVAVTLPQLHEHADSAGHTCHEQLQAFLVNVAPLVTGALTLLSPEGLLGSPFSSDLQNQE